MVAGVCLLGDEVTAQSVEMLTVEHGEARGLYVEEAYKYVH